MTTRAAAQKINSRNIFIITAMVVAAALIPLGTEYLFGDRHSEYLPMGEAFNRESALLWLHFVMDTLTGISYVAISATLAYLAYKSRRDLPFLWMFVAFGAFIVACGITHFMATWTLWSPAYYFAGGVKFVTAVASVTTAVALPSLVPRAQRLIESTKVSSQRKKDLERLNRLLQVQQRELLRLNEAKDEFISLASHQLRTPATGVKQYIGMLQNGYAGNLSREQLVMLELAYQSNERQIQIIDDLLRVAHVDAGKVTLNKEKTDLVKLLADVIKEQEGKFRDRKQMIRFGNDHDKLEAKIDKNRLRMVLENIVDNASKYTPEGKSIAVTIGTLGNRVLIEVADQGVGIDKKDLNKLFHKFSRIDNARSSEVGGSGLGLYWAQKIVKLHKGAIKVVSAPNQGTSFTITIPRGLQ